MPDPAWEDSLGSFDLRDLMNGEAIDRLLMTVTGRASTCRRASCRRHALCLGPMCQRPGARLPWPLMQLGKDGFRPACLQGPQPPFPHLTPRFATAHGAFCLAALEVLHPGLDTQRFLGRRIAESRAARASRSGSVEPDPLERIRDIRDRLKLIRPGFWANHDASLVTEMI